MIVNNHIEQEDLALYVMHLLKDSEARAIESHLDECEGCADAAALLRGDLAALAMTSEMHSPPAAARNRLTTQVAREKKILPIERAVHREAGSPLSSRLLITEEDVPEARPTSSILPWVSWIGWAVAAGLTVTVVDLYRERDDLQSAVAKQAGDMARLSSDAQRGRAILSTLTDQDAMRVKLSPGSAKPVPEGRATYLPEKGSLVFLASNLAPLAPYKTYELWLLPADGRDPIPAGTFQPDLRGNASVIMPLIPKGVVAKGFGVTIEDEGGSRQPTMPIVLSGA
jgi:anti-sigma-K factor RskA